jgi:probable selenium-dependent hydroxylase accessory protein YqeC
MAYVTAVCGSGGKTTLCKNLAAKYAKENKKVCITTTTNMWFDDDVRQNFFCGETCEPGKVYYAGHEEKKKSKLTPSNSDEYQKLCDIFDYVIIEADGSRAMPMKIPNAGEPIIPDNVNEIIIVVGMESTGRKIGYICHRFNEFYGKDSFLSDNNITVDSKVDETLIDKFVNHYYVEPISSKFPNAKIKVYKNDYCSIKISSENKEIIEPVLINGKDIPKKICVALCASGFSKRFGDENKLLARISVGKSSGLKLYQVMINKVLDTKKIVVEKFDNDLSINDLQIDVAVVSQYDEIINDPDYQKEVTFIKNENASAGLSSSIKLAVEKYKNYDAIVFLNSDMPNLSVDEFSRFIFNSILNNNKMAAMFTDMPKNPAYFEKEYFDEILKIDGDKGPRELLDNNIKDLYRYYIDPNQLFEIDTKEDLEKFNNA